jgi:hypothetical protein
MQKKVTSLLPYYVCDFVLITEMERVMGIEPTLSAWKAEVLPLNYTRINGAP